MLQPITDVERDLITHVSRWGSDGYPVRNLGRGWTWSFASIKGPPVIYKTKRDAVANFELFMALLRDRLGEEAYERAVERAGEWP